MEFLGVYSTDILAHVLNDIQARIFLQHCSNYKILKLNAHWTVYINDGSSEM